MSERSQDPSPSSHGSQDPSSPPPASDVAEQDLLEPTLELTKQALRRSGPTSSDEQGGEEPPSKKTKTSSVSSSSSSSSPDFNEIDGVRRNVGVSWIEEHDVRNKEGVVTATVSASLTLSKYSTNGSDDITCACECRAAKLPSILPAATSRNLNIKAIKAITGFYFTFSVVCCCEAS